MNQIGTIVDFIWNSIRCRGLVYNIEVDVLHIAVLGSKEVYAIHSTSCVPVVDNKEYINLCNPK